MFYTTFWLLLVSAHVASTAVYNGSAIVRTFAITRRDQMSTAELVDFEELLKEYSSPPPDSHFLPLEPYVFWRFQDLHNQSLREENGSWLLSDQARQFLGGPVSTVLIPSLYTLVCVVSLPLNAVALVVFLRRARPVKPAVVFMVNLAGADLLFALLLPFRIHYRFNGNHWTFGPVLCRVVTASFYCNMYCSVLLIACISVDRLLAVVYPVRSLGWRRPRYAAAACGVAWTLALAGSVPLVLSEQTVRLEELGITTCHDVQETVLLRRHYVAYFCAVAGGLFLLPMLVTLGCYARVIGALRRLPDKVGRNARRKARATLMAGTVLLLFLVCFAPSHCLLLLHYLQVSLSGRAADGSYVAYLVLLCVGSLNCCLDPLVYYFGSSQCQRQLSDALCCRARLRGVSNPYSSSGSSSRASSGTLLRSSRTGSTAVKAKPPGHRPDPFQSSLDSQCKKLLV